MTDLPVWSSLSAEQKIELVRPLWDEGLSASQIRFKFVGASRNAIISCVHRAKMPQRKSVITAPRPPRQKREPKPKKKMVKPSRVSSTAHVVFASGAAEPEPVMSAEKFNALLELRPPIGGTTPISILQLPDRAGLRCRFEVQGGYCGIECGDDMYCPTHKAIVYRPATEKLRVPKEARL